MDRYAGRNPGIVGRSDAEIARERLKMVRRSIERHGGPWSNEDDVRGYDGMQDERMREDAKQLLRVAYERQVAGGDVGLGVDLPAAAEERGMGHDSPHLAALVDFMEVAGWIEPDPGADPIGRGEVGMPVRRITGRGAEVLREDAG